MGIAYAAPYTPVRPLAPVFSGVELSWTGWDGSIWPLTSPETGLFLRPGVRGLGLPTFERQSSSSPVVAGSRHRGTSTKDRDVFWPLYIYSDAGSAGFMERYEAFWRSLDTDLEGTWTAVRPDGSRRTLNLRLSGADDVLNHDPVQRGWNKDGINLLADQPYWLGETVRKSWGQDDVRNYDVSEADRVEHDYADDVIHYLSSGGALGSATFTNDGDVPSYPVWTVVGPTMAVSFGVDGNSVIVPFEIEEGYAVQLDTDPIGGQVLWYGVWDPDEKILTGAVDRTAELDPMSAFVAIPRGQDKPLSFTMTGSGKIIAEVRNKYRRAF